MQNQRKRFSYLTVQQRALNSSNAIDNEKNSTIKTRSIMGSNIKSSKQQPSTTQIYTSFNRNSSIKKNAQPLTQIPQSSIMSNIKRSATKNPSYGNKQNILESKSTKSDQKPSFYLTSKPLSESSLQTRVKQLEEQNHVILKQTEQKFLLMEKHLQKVEGILKEKQATIESLSSENTYLKQKFEHLQSDYSQSLDQNKKMLDIIAEKDNQIKGLLAEKQSFAQKQLQLVERLKSCNLKSNLQPIQSIHPNPSQTNQPVNFYIQTELRSMDIEELLTRSREIQGSDKLNYRQKYQALFKKALEMEDEIYRLKQELFDSQNQVKTIQQEFNTYKIFNQIEKINQQI